MMYRDRNSNRLQARLRAIGVVALATLATPSLAAAPDATDAPPAVQGIASYRLAADTSKEQLRPGKRRPVAPKADRTRMVPEVPVIESFSINKGQARATSPLLTVHWSVGGGRLARPTHYQVSTSPGFSGEDWIAHRSTSARFQLPIGMRSSDGEVTVYFRMMNETGTSDVVSDSIQYVAPPRIASFEINNGDAWTSRPLLAYRAVVDGTATAYRVSESQGFEGVPWKTASQHWDGRGLYRIEDDANGSKTLHVQIRRESNQVVSASDSIDYQLQFTDYTYKNDQSDLGPNTVTAMIAFAQENGWEFERRKIGDGGVGCFVGGIRPNEASYFTGDPDVGGGSWRTGTFWAQGLYPILPMDPSQPETSKTECEFTLFDGRELNSGWRIKSVKLRTVLHPYEAEALADAFKLPVNLLTAGAVGGKCELKEGPAAHGKEPVFTIRVEYPAIPTPGTLPYQPCIVDEITLMGPPPPFGYEDAMVALD